MEVLTFIAHLNMHESNTFWPIFWSYEFMFKININNWRFRFSKMNNVFFQKDFLQIDLTEKFINPIHSKLNKFNKQVTRLP